MITEDINNFDKYIREYPDEMKLRSDYSSDMINSYRFYMIKYEKFCKKHILINYDKNDKLMQLKNRPRFRGVRLFNNMIVLFNLLFNENYPLSSLTKAQLRNEASYFDESYKKKNPVNSKFFIGNETQKT